MLFVFGLLGFLLLSVVTAAAVSTKRRVSSPVLEEAPDSVETGEVLAKVCGVVVVTDQNATRYSFGLSSHHIITLPRATIAVVQQPFL